MLSTELRPGSQHSEKGAVDFLERCAYMVRILGIPAEDILLRVDSGHDSADFFAKAYQLGFSSRKMILQGWGQDFSA